MSEAQDFDEMDLEILQDFIAESQDGITELDEKFVLLENDPSDKSNIDAIFRAIHSIKGNAGFFNLEALKNTAHKMETLLDEMREGSRSVNADIITILLEGVDILKAMLEQLATVPKIHPLTPKQEDYIARLSLILDAPAEDPQAKTEKLIQDIKAVIEEMKNLPELSDHDLVKKAEKILASYSSIQAHGEGQQGLVAPTAPPAPEISALSEASAMDEKSLSDGLDMHPADHIAAKEGDKKVVAKKTMRVDEDTIDGFMRYIGELIISSEVFNHLQKKLETNSNVDPSVVSEFKNANLSFNELSNELQNSLMEIRKVPLKNLLSKTPRLVRDLSKSLSKDVNLVMLGEETKVDKSLMEALEDPFVHMIRNSLDHGLETPQERTAAGKGAQGNLTIEGKCDKSFFYLIIQDDGRGIYPEKIKKVAISKGVITEEEAGKLTDKEAVNLIFAPGFSSAEQVSQVSGRGVGMDVVLTNIKSRNGNIDVESIPGQGTKIIIKLPLTVTLIVITGLILQVSEEKYIIPLDSVREVAEAKDELLSTIQGDTELITYRGEIFPLVRLHETFHLPCENRTLNGKILVLAETKGEKVGIVVDKLLGLQQMVQKNIGEEFDQVKMIDGGAIMGDGRVGLVLDVGGLISHCQKATV